MLHPRFQDYMPFGSWQESFNGWYVWPCMTILAMLSGPIELNFIPLRLNMTFDFGWFNHYIFVILIFKTLFIIIFVAAVSLSAKAIETKTNLF